VSLTSLLKAIRASQPLNWLATTAAHAGGRLAGRQSEFLVTHLPRQGGVSRRLPNGRTLRLWSRGDDWVANQVFWRGWNGYEPETTVPFFELALRSRVTLDVGAHVGLFSLLAAHANPQGRVFAFEPHPTAFERLGRNVELNGLANIERVRAAAGASDGEADFYFGETDAIPGSSSLSHAFMEGVPNVRRASVQVRSLDAFLAERAVGALDLMKLDTETTEPDVLRGCRESIARFRPAIICEVLRGRARSDELRSLLRAFDYRARLLTPEGAVPDDALEGDDRWRNYLLLPAERS
jgi:FkbM family methyltransferase